MAEKRKMLEGKRAKIAGVLSTVLVAATPGIYSAWENAKNTYTLSNETKVRDKLETDLQDNVKANEKDIEALKSTCATHKDLLALVLRMRGQDREGVSRPVSELSTPRRSIGLSGLPSVRRGGGRARHTDVRPPQPPPVSDPLAALRKRLGRSRTARKKMEEAKRLRKPYLRPDEQRAILGNK